MRTAYRLVETGAGWLAFVSGPRGLKRVYLPEPLRARLESRVRSDFADADENDGLLPVLARQLRQYFAGECVDFNARFDWSGHGAFEVAVWKACGRIEFGQTASYKSLAQRVGHAGAARAVGTAMSRNPFPILIPCHRVLKSDGSLGGYSGAQGVRFKERLLNMEADACEQAAR
ncbi:MAG: Methylated-DNA--protein-cysteine methyltransferase [Phycisphaerae bacterium]|nr:Methylated-DNA--protein-cysteine methyltransferase [Phycisphaerae bacterium]